MSGSLCSRGVVFRRPHSRSKPRSPRPPLGGKYAATPESPTFAMLVGQELAKALEQDNIRTPNSMQAEALRAAIDWPHRDIVVVAQTGSGKTLTFLLPILLKIEKDRKKGANAEKRRCRYGDSQWASSDQEGFIHPITALVLAPTAELAEQHFRIAQRLHPGGGHGVLFTTPTAFLGDYTTGTVDTSHLSVVAIDEADAILCEGAHDDTLPKNAVTLLNALRKNNNPQFLLTAAYLTSSQSEALQSAFPDASRVTEARSPSGSKRGELVPTLRKKYLFFTGVDKAKEKLLLKILDDSRKKEGKTTLVFFSTVADILRIQSSVNGLAIDQVLCLHEDMTESERALVWRSISLDSNVKDSTKVVLCTDVAARGMDANVEHVVLFDVPTNITLFLHSAGRTARRGKTGLVTCLCETGTNDYGRFKHLIGLRNAPALKFD